jgi:protease PrsW
MGSGWPARPVRPAWTASVGWPPARHGEAVAMLGHAPPPALRPRTSALAVTTAIVLGLIALGVAVLLIINASPVPVIVSAFAAALSFPLLIALCFWLDTYEPEPGRYRLAALAWGGTVAVLIGAGLSYVLGYLVSDSEVIAAVVWAPLTEEFGKALFLIVLVALRPRQVHGPLDGAIYAALVGIGFSFVEDTLYYSVGFLGGGAESLATLVVLRGVLGAFSHSLYAAMFGIGLGIAVQTRSAIVRVVAPLLGFVLAVLLHALWNASVTFYDFLGFVLAYALVMLPALGIVTAWGAWARDREGATIRRSLAECAQFGLIHPAEIELVANLRSRRAVRKQARRLGGGGAERAVLALQQTLIEMAFLHAQVRRGQTPPDVHARMAALTSRAAALRPYVPPPLPLTSALR